METKNWAAQPPIVVQCSPRQASATTSSAAGLAPVRSVSTRLLLASQVLLDKHCEIF